LPGWIAARGGGSYSGCSCRAATCDSGNDRVLVSIVDGNLVSGIGRTIAVKLKR
jgi:hypothetical protein